MTGTGLWLWREWRREFDVDGDGGVGGVVDVADELFCDDGDVAVGFVGGVDEFPFYFGSVGGNAAVDFAVEVFDDFGAAVFPPHLWSGGFFWPLIVIRGSGRSEIRRNFSSFKIGRVWRSGIPVGTAAQCGDVQFVHDSLVVFFGGELNGLRVFLLWFLCLRRGGQKRKQKHAR